MACTTILVGKGATNDGSTIIARNEDCENGAFNAKSMMVVKPEDQPRKYTGVTNHLTIELPDDPLRYTCTPNTDPSAGIWGEAGINSANVAMTATETISSNARVLGADPLVCYKPAKGTEGSADFEPEQPGGIGEENLLTIILPYIRTAKEGVKRMGALLEEYGTYEMNGVAFADEDEIWYIETIGGHHWIARRVPDDAYVAQPNRLGIDKFDLVDAFSDQNEFMCSKDLPEWMAENHLDVTLSDTKSTGFLEGFVDDDKFHGIPRFFNPREAFGSYTWLDEVYNNSRAWYICSMLNMDSPDFHGIDPKYGPQSFDIPWCMTPKTKISVMDVKNLLSSTYDGTIYDPYGLQGTDESRHRFRDIGINRTCECSVLTIRPYAPEKAKAVQWVAFGSGPFNTAIAMFTNVNAIPDYLATGMEVSTDKFYWVNRMVAALADPEFFANFESISAYQQQTMADGYAAIHEMDKKLVGMSDEEAEKTLEQSNERLVAKVKAANSDLLGEVLFERSLHMKNAFGASDH